MRIYHPWHKWECYKSGFYRTEPPNNMSADECKKRYAKFLSCNKTFEYALNRVIREWKHSCEHFLTNENINRVAWLGQASLCIETGIPSIFRSGFNLLSDSDRVQANNTAKKYLRIFLEKRSGGLI